MECYHHNAHQFSTLTFNVLDRSLVDQSDTESEMHCQDRQHVDISDRDCHLPYGELCLFSITEAQS